MAALFGIGFTGIHLLQGSALVVILLDAALYGWVAASSGRRLVSAVGLLVLWPALFLLPAPMTSVGEYALLLPILGGVPKKDRWWWVAYSVASLALLTTLTVYRKGIDLLPASLIGWSFFVVGTWVLALLVTWTAQVEQRAHKQALTEHRLALTRDLHDKVGSQLALIANHIRGAQATATEVDLDLITDTADDAIDQIRILLHHLRAADGDTRANPAPTVQDTLDDAQRRLNRAGFTVMIASKGAVESVPASTASVAAPIVYEAVTNIIRHGDPQAICTIHVTIDDVAVHATLANTVASTTAANHDGFGIKSMRERAAACDGSVDTELIADAWKTHIILPYRGTVGGKQ